ncbi:MAG: Serine--tRNA ligase [Firmicutes bacterium ADurb.Bin193]|nr:MAG: Serine--tRNA ligase [Firmicutes bacterium ADurb.Bin193]
MLDIKLIRSNPEAVMNALSRRGGKYSLDEFLETDKRRRELLVEAEGLKAHQNAVSKSIPALKKEGKDVSSVFADMKEISDKVKVIDEKLRELDAELERILLSLPNIPSERVKTGASDEDNEEIRKWGEPTKFSFEPKTHWELGESLGILDAATAAKVTGTRFTFYRGDGAKLERAVINFFLDTHTQNGYTEVFPPFMVHRNSMQGTGQLPKFEEDAFKVANTDYFLIPTAEVPVTNMHRDEILSDSVLPIKYCAYSACFRAEAGSAGRDTRGIIRQHQFNKVELVKFCRPEDSYSELESLTADAERVLQLLKLPYRVVRLCSGDMGFSSAMTYDIEVWMPSYGRYVEISSCSNFEDFQARRAGIRFRREQGAKAELVHTLNGSGVAVGRTVACIMENFQNEDGTITIPDVLVPYMNKKIIGGK